jgi:micrococcal nuclease
VDARPVLTRGWRAFRGIPFWAQLTIGLFGAAILVSPFTPGQAQTVDMAVAGSAPTTAPDPTTSHPNFGEEATTIPVTTIPVTTTVIVMTKSTSPAGVPADGDDTAVVRVIDGDTIVVTGGTRIRLIGIDTPETVDPSSPLECFGPEASRYATEMLPIGARIRLVYDVERLDHFGRTLAYVYKLDDGVFVNLALARDGYAVQATFPPNVAHAEEFRAAVGEARDADLGLWGACQSSAAAALPEPTPAPPATVAVAPVVGESGDCHPSYAGACVPTGFSDVDCAGGNGNGPGYVSTKNFQVVGPDVYGLDGDGDGVACVSR